MDRGETLFKRTTSKLGKGSLCWKPKVGSPETKGKLPFIKFAPWFLIGPLFLQMRNPNSKALIGPSSMALIGQIGRYGAALIGQDRCKGGYNCTGLIWPAGLSPSIAR